MKKEALLALIVISLFSQAVFAELIPDKVFLSDMLRINVSEYSSLKIYSGYGSGSVDFIRAGLSYFPRDEFRQKVEVLDVYPPASRSRNSIDFYWSRPSADKLEYGVRSKVLTVNEFRKIRQKIAFPVGRVPADVSKFLEHTDNIDWQNPLIVKKANELVSGEDDLFVVVSRIALWVKENINYSLSTMTEEVSQPASWVLKNRVGVCDELTSLFIALLRAVGVPAKFAAGLSYSNIPGALQKWGPHGWAEVYFPNVGWVPFDPTFGEFGWLDPGHIKMKESVDAVDPATKFEWRGKNANIDISPLEFSANVLSFGERVEPMIKISVQVLKAKTGFGSWNVVEAEVENLKDYYITTQVNLAKVKEIKVSDDFARHLILMPFEKKTVFWQVKITPELQKKYSYKIPVFVYTLRNETARAEILTTATGPVYSPDELESVVRGRIASSSPDAAVKLFSDCRAVKNFYSVGEPAGINCVFTNEDDKKIDFSVCIDGACEFFSLNSAQKKLKNYLFDNVKIGVKDIVINIKSGDFVRNSFVSYTVIDAPHLEFENISAPNEILFDEKKRMHFYLSKKSWADPQDVVVKIEGGSTVQQVKFDELEGDVPFIFVVDGKALDSGQNLIKLRVVFKDVNNKNYFVEKDVNVSLVNVTAEQKVRIWFRKLGFF